MPKRPKASAKSFSRARATKKAKYVPSTTSPKEKIEKAKEMKWSHCSRCGAARLDQEERSFCCGIKSKKNKDGLPLIELPVIPEVLQNLIKQKRELRCHARKYNNLFSYSAVGATGEHGFFHIEGGISCLNLQGRTYHRMVNASSETGPMRWILNDGNHGFSEAMKQKTDRDIVTQLRAIMQQFSPFWNKLKNVSEEQMIEAKMLFVGHPSREIAVLIVPSHTKDYEPRSVVCYSKHEQTGTFIESTNGLFFPLHYVLINPCGTFGWDRNATAGLTMLQFYRQLLLRHNTMHLLGPLLNEYLVDIYSAIEDQRLSFLRFNQKKICKKRDLAPNNPGRIVLPSSFIGSRRYFADKIADALAIVREYGKPTFFVTVTCNPNWPEIQAQLTKGQTSADRPDVVCRVFHAKLKKIIAYLPKALKGGKRVYIIWVIEFQQRGLPHAHIAIKFEKEPLTPEEIDVIISAELPVETDSTYDCIKKHMIHGHRKSCYKNGSKTCKHGYSKDKVTLTYTDERGYVHHRRRCDLDINVVPHCVALIQTFDCHINVEVSHSVMVVTYLYKYFYKGFDHAKGQLTVDEISHYIEGRYLSATEAAWRFFSYTLTRRSPTKAPIVARMATIRPQSGDVWYLRLLLKTIPARSYKDLLTIDGIEYRSFCESAKALGLLQNSSEPQLCLREAVEDLCDAHQLRCLFVSLVTEGAPAPALYTEFYPALSEDFTFKHCMSTHEASNATLCQLQMQLEACGKTLESIGLPEPDIINSEIDRQLSTWSYKQNAETALRNMEMLNSEQKHFFEHVQSLLRSGNGGLLFLNGAAGRGKTFVLNTIIAYVRGQQRIALCCASSGFAAALYPGGRTAHNLFKIDVITDHSIATKVQCSVTNESERAELLRMAAVIIWDEFVMSHKENFEAVDSMLRVVRNITNIPCGNIIFIAAGDFRQIPPVVRNAYRADTVNASIKRSTLWKYFTKFHLTISMRQAEDPSYSRLVDCIGDGIQPEDENGNVSLPDMQTTADVDSLITFVFPNIMNGEASTQHCAILTLRNQVVDQLNQKVISYLKGEQRSLYSVDTLNDADGVQEYFDRGLTEDFFNSLNMPNIPPYELKLQTGMECYLLRNLSPMDNLLNNTSVRILQMSRNILKIVLLESGAIKYLPRISFTIQLPRMPFSINRRQFPIRPAYVKTINRSQGATLDKCGLDLREPPFSHGHLLVAMSRVRNRKDIMILINPDQLIKNTVVTRNVVFKELLL